MTAVLCTENSCGALATHAVRQAATNCAWVLCHWCAIRYVQHAKPAATLTRLRSFSAVLAGVNPEAIPCLVTRGAPGTPRDLGTITAEQARQCLDRAHRDGWAIRIHPDGSWAALDTTSGWDNPAAQTITATPHPMAIRT